MNSLFPADSFLPPGFEYYPDFITETEEMNIMKQVGNIELKALNFQGFEAKRKVASFGYDWSFEKRTLTKGKEIPKAFDWIIDRAAKLMLLKKEDFSEILITEYPIGSVINWHRDAPPFDIIVGISLLSDCSFKLKPYGKIKTGRSSIITLPVKARSVYIMQGESRANWMHSISAVKQVRYSITLRTLRNTTLI